MLTIDRRRGRCSLLVCALFAVLCLVYTGSWPSSYPYSSVRTAWSPQQSPIQSSKDVKGVTLVVASQSKDNTTWLQDTSESWRKLVYLTDVPSNLSVPANKGREAMVYLTNIIDNYDQLSPITIFLHANRYQWHNDDPLYDGLRMLRRLRLPYVRSQGYLNLRCVWTLGCPTEIKPFEESGADLPAQEGQKSEDRAGSFYKDAFEELFPDKLVPQAVGASCCAQFAVTAAKIRERPKRDYERYREWLLNTSLADDLSGRIMEYSWHIIFGKRPVHCPNAFDCYCKVYGLCHLSCEAEGTCSSQYWLPKYSVMPAGWPDLDWDGKWRNVTELRIEQERDFDVLPDA